MELRVGQRATLQRTFTQEDFNRFADLSGDDNPIHVDEEFAASTYFGRTVAHGMLLYSTLSSLLGKQLPGPGSWQVEQELMFPAPTFSGEPVDFTVEVSGFPTNQLVEVSTRVTRADGEAGATGKAILRLPGEHARPPAKLSIPSGSPETGLPPGSQEIHLKGLSTGQQASIKRTYTQTDLSIYAELTGDMNPLFADAPFAKRNGFEGVIIPGPLLGALFSYLLGTRLPGRGTNWLKQSLSFQRPAYPQVEIIARVEIIRLRPEKNLVNLRTTCVDQAGALLCDGEALVAVRDLLAEDRKV